MFIRARLADCCLNCLLYKTSMVLWRGRDVGPCQAGLNRVESVENSGTLAVRTNAIRRATTIGELDVISIPPVGRVAVRFRTLGLIAGLSALLACGPASAADALTGVPLVVGNRTTMSFAPRWACSRPPSASRAPGEGSSGRWRNPVRLDLGEAHTGRGRGGTGWQTDVFRPDRRCANQRAKPRKILPIGLPVFSRRPGGRRANGVIRGSTWKRRSRWGWPWSCWRWR